jgi:hypothetical protein
MTFMAYGILGGVLGWSASLGLFTFYASGALLAAVAAGIGWFST